MYLSHLTLDTKNDTFTNILKGEDIRITIVQKYVDLKLSASYAQVVFSLLVCSFVGFGRFETY